MVVRDVNQSEISCLVEDGGFWCIRGAAKSKSKSQWVLLIWLKVERRFLMFYSAAHCR